MKVGDLVKWIGFPGADKHGIHATGPKETGIIIGIYRKGYRQPLRVTVAWGNGTIGEMLYPQTIKVVSKINQ